MATVGRFAPSPTGALHLGSARTALLAWLVARSAPGGRCLLRIDDLDRPRVRAGAEDGQRADLAWLGLDFDPPELRQSARAGAYDAALRTLDARGLLYRCVCTRRDLAAISAPHGPEGPRYPGTCRPPGPPAPLGRLDGPGSLRLRLPAGEIAVDDLVAGRFTSDPQAPDRGGDVVVRRADGLHGYHLATVVDDAASDVTVVVRGDDLLASTPRQVAIGRALGVATPAYAHVPLVLDEHGERLAKRRRPAAIADLRAHGLSASRVVGDLARSAGLVDDATDRTPAELLATFELASLATRLARRR